VLFVFLYKNLLQDVAVKKFEKEKIQLVQNEKRYLRNEVEAVLKGLSQIRVMGYYLAQREMNELLKLVIKNRPCRLNKKFFKRHYTDTFFFWDKSVNFTFPEDIKISEVSIEGNRFLTITHNNKRYLAVSARTRNGTIGIAFSLKIIKETIQKNMFKFLNKINKNKLSYIAVGQITNWNPGKDGVFAKIIYMPPRLKSFIGNRLSINQPDIKGHYYRKEFFQSLKKGKNCFVEYYFKNPDTMKYEKKISFFALYKPYNWVIVKGIYLSQIENIVEKNKNIIFANVKQLFTATFIVLLMIAVISFFVAYGIGGVIVGKVINEYEQLKNKYNSARKELEKRAFYDVLTKLPNRNKLVNEIDGFESMILVDIDNFSTINDVYGFDFGNEVLKFVSECLKKDNKNIYRVGSDEFALCYKEKIDKFRILKILNTPCEYNGIKISLSLGASNIKNRLFETAETALKLALKNSRVNYMIYDEKMDNEQKQNLEKIQILYKIYEQEGVIPFYQCIVDQNQNIIKYEALMRLKYNDEIYSPFEFMEILKNAKLYNRFSQLMIKKVFENLHKINKPVSVNLSYEDIDNEATKALIYKNLKKNSNIVFEILETENIEQMETITDFIRKIKNFGAKIAIDDFGSGYSNFVNVLSLDPDYIKLDASLVKKLEDEKYIEIIKLINSFAEKFNIKTIAEFVSDREKFEILKKIGIDEFQGFYFCEPKPLEKLI
jgi:diguanylate cyclase (GGDEF)-like protein